MQSTISCIKLPLFHECAVLFLLILILKHVHVHVHWDADDDGVFLWGFQDGHAAIKQDIHESRADGKGLDDTSNPDVVNAAHVVNASPDADVSKLESELTQREQSDAPKEHAQPPSGQEGSVILAGAENPEDSRINQGLDEGSSSTAGEYYGTITSVGGAYQPWRLFFIGLFSVGCLYMVFNYFKRGKSPRRNH